MLRGGLQVDGNLLRRATRQPPVQDFNFKTRQACSCARYVFIMLVGQVPSPGLRGV